MCTLSHDLSVLSEVIVAVPSEVQFTLGSTGAEHIFVENAATFQYYGDDGWQDYPADVQESLNAGKTHEYTINNWPYRVDQTSQTNLKTKKVRKVRKVTSDKVHYHILFLHAGKSKGFQNRFKQHKMVVRPYQHKIKKIEKKCAFGYECLRKDCRYEHPDDFILFDEHGPALQAIHCSSALFKNISDKFHTYASRSYTIVKIEKVVKPTRYKLFQAQKQAMVKKLKSRVATHPTEIDLHPVQVWHGAPGPCVPKIIETGFDHRFNTTAAFGQGVYFHMRADYPCSDAYSAPDKDGIKKMFLSTLILGEYTTGNSSYKRPQPKKDAPNDTYDSFLCGQGYKEKVQGGHARIIVMCRDNQAYPEFLVSFKK